MTQIRAILSAHSHFRWAAACCALLLLAGCGDGEAQQAPQSQPVAVSTITLEPQPVTYSERLPGRVTAYKVAEIRPQVSGVIMKRYFTEGSMVKEGQQLYQIDPALYEAAYNSAKADVQRAKANVKSVQAREKRYAELVAIDAVSKQEYDDIKAALTQARADVAVAEAQLATAKINLDYTKVYSPISGRIGKSTVTEGALVTAGQPEALTRVTQLDPTYVDMTQSSADLLRIRNQMGGEMPELPVTLALEGGQPYEHQGKLQFSDVTVEETTGSVQLRALFPNPEGILLPGMFVQAEVQLKEREEILVPQKATIRDRDGNLTVWVMGADNTANPAPIQVSREYKDQWIVTSGVKEGDALIIEGYQRLRPGAPVSAAAPAQGQPAPSGEQSAPTQPESPQDTQKQE